MKSLDVCLAAYRAVESREKDALFQDPMAESLAGEQAIQQVTMLHFVDGIQTVLGACASASRQHSECSDLSCAELGGWWSCRSYLQVLYDAEIWG